MVDSIAVGAHLADEETGPFQGDGGVVYGGGVDLGLSESEAQFGQMGDLVHLSAGGLEEDGRADSAMDVAQSSPGVRIQGFGMGHGSGEVSFDGHLEPRLPQLAQDHGAKIGQVQGR